DGRSVPGHEHGCFPRRRSGAMVGSAPAPECVGEATGGGVGMETVDVDGIRVAYERVGEGPPLVLLHGYVGDGPATWRRQLDALSDEFTVVAWDAPGAGGSADPPEMLGMAGYADCLAGFVDALGLTAPHIVGLSFGGAL